MEFRLETCLELNDLLLPIGETIDQLGYVPNEFLQRLRVIQIELVYRFR
jgi:hypothetical protein